MNTADFKNDDRNLGIIMMPFGKTSDFNVVKGEIVTMAVWQNQRKSDKSYDQ